jgi:RNA-directed DNA polymerase
MTSTVPKHIEPTSGNHQGAEESNGPCSSDLPTEKTASAVMEKSALNSQSSSLMEVIVDESNMERAWQNVKANKGAPGPDGITLDEFPESFRHHWPEVRQQLLEGTYRPGPARRKSIPKPDGSQRHLAHRLETLA